MSPTTPLISVIIAVLNGERYITEALESILQQNYTPLEIIVVDDGSTDNTAAVVQNFTRQYNAPLRYVYQINQGQPTAHNYGLRLAQGQVITFLDADDLWPDQRLEAQLPRLTTPAQLPDTAPGIVLGRKHYFVDGANVNPAELDYANNRPFHYTLAASLFARWVFDKVGWFDQSMLYQADWDWFVRAKTLAIPTAVVPQVTLLGRIHTQNRTRRRDTDNKFAVHMLRKHLNHLREQNG